MSTAQSFFKLINLNKSIGGVRLLTNFPVNCNTVYVNRRSISNSIMSCGCSNQGESSFRQKFMTCVQERQSCAPNKISIVGTGRTGAATAFAIIAAGISCDLCLIDINKDYIEAQALDILHSSAVYQDSKIVGSNDYKDTANSKIVLIVCGGADDAIGKTRMDLLDGSVKIMKEVIPSIMKYSKAPIFYVITNPCDVITYVVWRLSGLPKTNVLGSGTQLDSNRLRFHVATRLKIGVSSVKGWMLGEHGETMVPIWSSVTAAGIRLMDLNPKIGLPEDPDNWDEVYKEARSAGIKIYKAKLTTEWGIAATAADVIKAILYNTNGIYAASICVKGLFGIEDDVFMSLPAMLGCNGVTDIVKPNFTETELKRFRESAAYIANMQNKIKF